MTPESRALRTRTLARIVGPYMIVMAAALFARFDTLALMLPAIAIVAWQAQVHGHIALGAGAGSDVLIALSGVVTAVPLLLFAIAARRMDYSTLGFIQFLAPTLVFVIGLTVFHEPLRPVQLACFVAIWSAIAIFVWDLLARRWS